MSFTLPLVVLRQPRASLSTRDLARAFGVSKKTISTWTSSGWLPAPRLHRGDAIRTIGLHHYRAPTRRWCVGDLVQCYLW